MILEALVKYYENLAEQDKVSRPGWCQEKVSYGINLTKDGSIKEILFLKHEEDRGKKKILLPTQRRVPQRVTRSSGIVSNYLCDNSKYILGIDKNGIAESAFEAAREKHLELLKNVDSDIAEAVRLYFQTRDILKASENKVIREYWD